MIMDSLKKNYLTQIVLLINFDKSLKDLNNMSTHFIIVQAKCMMLCDFFFDAQHNVKNLRFQDDLVKIEDTMFQMRLILWVVFVDLVQYISQMLSMELKENHYF